MFKAASPSGETAGMAGQRGGDGAMAAIRIARETDILGLVDIQPTFMPGGELPVPQGDRVVAVINRLLARFDHAFATQDWHPRGHSSFASAHPGRAPYDTVAMPYGDQILWPDHALQGTPNAALHADLDAAKVEVIIRKGFHKTIDSYSAFFENDRRTPTGLDGWLRQRGFRRVFLAGLAFDFCVAWSAEDAHRLGYEVMVIADASSGIGVPTAPGRTSIDDTQARFASLGIQVITSANLA
jgi:nicotinamidase/pyrazinamidase